MTGLTMQAPYLLLMLGAAALVALIGGDDGGGAAEQPPEPDPDPEPVSPFESVPGFDAALFAETRIGTDSDDSLTADAETPTAIAGLAGGDRINGGGGGDVIVAGAGDDTVLAGGGDDTVLGQAGDDNLDGGAGADWLMAGAGDDLVHGGAGDDRIAGDPGDDSLAGGRGADLLLGGAGDDVLSGLNVSRAAPSDLGESLEDGRDTLLGEAGDDTLWLSAGDLATGGSGADTFAIDHRVLQPGDPAEITDYVPGEDRVVVHVTPGIDPATNRMVAPSVTMQGNAALNYTTVMADGVPIGRVLGIADPAQIALSRVVEGA